jgi:hypothetical protein
MASLEVCLDLGSSKLHRGAFTDTFVETPQWMQVFSSAMFGSEDSRRLEVTQPVWPGTSEIPLSKSGSRYQPLSE